MCQHIHSLCGQTVWLNLLNENPVFVVYVGKPDDAESQTPILWPRQGHDLHFTTLSGALDHAEEFVAFDFILRLRRRSFDIRAVCRQMRVRRMTLIRRVKKQSARVRVDVEIRPGQRRRFEYPSELVERLLNIHQPKEQRRIEEVGEVGKSVLQIRMFVVVETLVKPKKNASNLIQP